MLKNGPIILSSLLLAAVHSTSANQKQKVVAYESCGENEKARTLAKLVVEDGDQQRSSLRCNSLLTSIAQEKAEEMALTGKVSHRGTGGGLPDQRLIDAGYLLKLPDGAGYGGNHVEAVQGGESHPEDILSRFKNSYQHRVHLFGEHEFFLQQDEIGVGYAYNWDSPHVDYWVVYIASQANSADLESD